ncbi:hypothetical protein NYY70_20125, partial [Acinetobacter baumannii]|nr:hypothetical protein [Acinetobacter baumannii]
VTVQASDLETRVEAAAERAGGHITDRTQAATQTLETAFSALGHGFEAGAAAAVQSLRGSASAVTGEVEAHTRDASARLVDTLQTLRHGSAEVTGAVEAETASLLARF